MKFGQLIEYLKRKMFFKNHAGNEAGSLVSGLFLKQKKLCVVKARGLQLSFNIFQ